LKQGDRRGRGGRFDWTPMKAEYSRLGRRRCGVTCTRFYDQFDVVVVVGFYDDQLVFSADRPWTDALNGRRRMFAVC